MYSGREQNTCCQLILIILPAKLTGVTVVSSHPQSTTSPVTLPLAASARIALGVNATLGHFKLSNNVDVIISLMYVGRNVFSTTMTLRCLPSVRRCLA